MFVHITYIDFFTDYLDYFNESPRLTPLALLTLLTRVHSRELNYGLHNR